MEKWFGRPQKPRGTEPTRGAVIVSGWVRDHGRGRRSDSPWDPVGSDTGSDGRIPRGTRISDPTPAPGVDPAPDLTVALTGVGACGIRGTHARSHPLYYSFDPSKATLRRTGEPLKIKSCNRQNPLVCDPADPTYPKDRGIRMRDPSGVNPTVKDPHVLRGCLPLDGSPRVLRSLAATGRARPAGPGWPPKNDRKRFGKQILAHSPKDNLRSTF
jgi:hypothetical protein